MTAVSTVLGLTLEDGTSSSGWCGGDATVVVIEIRVLRKRERGKKGVI